MPLTRRSLLATLPAAFLGCRGPRPAPTRPEAPFDVCIVGSGFAGVYLGLRLVARGARTLILEAGAEPQPGADPAGAARRFPILSRGPETYPVDAARSLSVGGTSNRWTGVLSRLSPEDLRTRTLYGLDRDWPLDYRELAPYYCRAEALLAARGGAYQPGAEPPRECPYPRRSRAYRSPAPFFAGRGPSFFPLAFSQRPSGGPVRLAEEEIPAFRSSPLAAFRNGAEALRLVPHGRRVEHLLVGTPGGGVEAVRARYFVVAAGVFESARLLLASRSKGFSEGLGNHSGHLGRHFSAHPAYDLRFPPREDLPRGAHRSLELAGRLRSRGLGAAHLQLQAGRGETLWSLQQELEPGAGSRLVLESGGGSRGRPGAALRFRTSERDRRTREAGLAARDELARALGLEPAAGRASERYRFHPAGLCRMSGSPELGVVDRHCQVFGLENLFVSGAAVFPTAGTANPTLTVVALTLRLGDHLLARLGLGPPHSI